MSFNDLFLHLTDGKECKNVLYPEILQGVLTELNDPKYTSVKDYLLQHIIYLIYNNELSLHTVLTGSNSELKKDIKRFLTDIWYSLGKIPDRNIKKINRSHLVGEYVGHSEKKTRELLNDPECSVLMIDEAYVLNCGSNDTFGREALDAINTYLSRPIIFDEWPNHSSLSRKISWNI